MNPHSSFADDLPQILDLPILKVGSEIRRVPVPLNPVGHRCHSPSEPPASAGGECLPSGTAIHPPVLSVVIPVFNEEDNVLPLAWEILTALGSPGNNIEVIFVDDASTDATADRLRMCGLPSVRVIRHRVNAGQSAAVATGFRHAAAEWVGTLDGDRQNDPADLVMMHATALRERVDCVTGVRIRRKDSPLRKISSRIANNFRNLITGDQIIDSGCGIRVIRRSALAEIPVFNGMHRFLPTLLRGQGYAVIEQTVNHRERTCGVSKYGVGNRLWRGIRDCFGVRWYLGRTVVSNRTGGTGDA